MPDFAFRKGSHIKSAAIHVGRLVYTGHTHADAVVKADDEHGGGLFQAITKQGGLAASGFGQGFITDSNRFVSRKEADKIARRSKQVGDRRLLAGGKLAAEDLRRNPDDSVWTGEKLK